METIVEKLKKIEALANSGIDGERENAKRMLDALCAKHGVTVDELVEPTLSWYRFRPKDHVDEMLLCHVVGFVCQTRRIKMRKAGKARHLELTRAQALDVEEAIRHYRKVWRENLTDYMAAFIHAHRLYAPRDEGAEPPEISAEDIMRAEKLIKMSRGISTSHWERRLKLEGAL